VFKIFISVLLLTISPCVFANDAPWGGGPGRFAVGFGDAGTATSTTINTNFVKDTSGQFIGVHFSSPVSQTSGSLTWYVYCTAQTGTTDLTAAKIYPGPTGTEDDDRPAVGASELATSGTVDASGCGTAQWLTYSFTGVTLTQGNHYWLGVYNTEADPVNNTVSIMTRGLDDGFLTNATFTTWGVMTTSDGFATDSVNSATQLSPTVLKFNNGSVFGMPYVAAGAAHANNTNMRGMRVYFTEDVKVGCVDMQATDTSFNFNTFEIYDGANSIKSITWDRYSEANSGELCFSSVTLTGGVDYDFVVTFSAADNAGTTHTMGNNPPADVQVIGQNWTYVDGATAGSLTEATTTAWFGTIILDDNPAISSSSGTNANQSVAVGY